MATVGNIIGSQFPADTAQINGSTPSATSGSGSTAAGGLDPLANESTFLQLLVAQLKNQNPSQPMDGTTFVTQLAQFSDLEQNLAMRQDLDSITAKYVTGPGAAASTPNSPQTTTNSQSDKAPGA